MLMKWEDLEPGDVLKYSEKAKDRFGKEEWCNIYKDENLTISKVDIILDDFYIRVEFRNKTYRGSQYRIHIDLNGKWNEIVLFEIVSLKED